MSSHSNPLIQTDQPTTAEKLLALRDGPDHWLAFASGARSVTEREAEALARMHGAFKTLLVWIERCPDRCQEMGLWWGGTALDHLNLPLPDLIDLTCPEGPARAAQLMRGIYALRGKGFVAVDEEWRVSPRSGQAARTGPAQWIGPSAS